MKTTFLTATFFLVAAVSLFAGDTNSFTDEKARISYAIGMMIGNNLKQQNIDVNDADFLRGLDDLKAGKPTLMTTQEAQAALRDFQQKARVELAAKNKAEGEAFLATNKNQSGVVTLPDGLQYKIITDGNGAMPTPMDTVTVNYRGTFANGKEFDSSKPGRPATLSLRNIIPGWREALLKMKVGSQWKVFIPSDLAYGENSPRGLPPNSVLIFEIELLSTETPPPPAPTTSDIIKVQGTNIERIRPEDAQRMQLQSHTN